ncbi:hypothetical protein SAMN05421857_3011 [Chryseobacterium formosense]|nr:hypothetical protein SAMN05421857_3011 [Chryseobacterium formosense]
MTIKAQQTKFAYLMLMYKISEQKELYLYDFYRRGLNEVQLRISSLKSLLQDM